MKIPEVTVARLARYLYHLRCLEERGIESVSSHEIAFGTGVNSNLVRKDLSYFGGFGKRGVGYDVSNLKRQIMKILDFTKSWPVIVVGAGKLGAAVCSCPDLRERGFQVVGVFDNNLRRVKRSLAGVKILPMKNLPEVVEQYEVKIGIVTVPKMALPEVVELMKNSGINRILTFGWCPYSASEKALVRNVDFVTELEKLVFKGKDFSCQFIR